MSADKTGFVVIYQWRLKAGMEAQFRAAWEELTDFLQQRRGARGSRLHTTEQGTWLAYAQWPDKGAWERSCVLHEQDEALSRRILEAVEEAWPPTFLIPVADHPLPEPDETKRHVTH